MLRFDLYEFFPSTPSSQVFAVFTVAGYPREVARLLTGLCTNQLPGEIMQSRNEMPVQFSYRHLPQGAPTSPALSNLCALRLDRRLAGLAHSLGADYTRYADDLAFSGGKELERSARRFQVHVARIALEEGYEVNTHKSRFMRQGVRQQLAGIVVNRHANIMRTDYDRLKAILNNCIRCGPGAQNREGRQDFRAYLAGRVAYIRMINSHRGNRLKRLFDRISWDT